MEGKFCKRVEVFKFCKQVQVFKCCKQVQVFKQEFEFKKK